MTIIGVVAGIGLFLLARPLVAKIPLDDATWFPASIVPPLLPAIVLLLAIPVVGVGAAVVALRRVVVTPLGVQRRQTPGMPASAARSRSWRRSSCCRSRSRSCAAARPNVLAIGLVGVAFGGVIVGIVLVGPWLTYLVGRVLHALPGRRLDAARVAAADRRPARVVRGDRRRDHGGLRRERVLLVRGVRGRPGIRPGRRHRRGPGLRRDAVQRGTAVRRGPRPDRGRAGRPFRAADRDRRADGDRPATAWVVPCVDLARQFGLPVGVVRRRLGQGPLGRWRHAARARRRTRSSRTAASGGRSR